METSFLIYANHESNVGEARRAAHRLAGDMNFSEEDAGRLALVVTEGVSNLIKHAGQGELVVGPGLDGQSVEVLFFDKGPGMDNISECMNDGYSTTGTLGVGLGALSRLSDDWYVASSKADGTLLASRIGHRDMGRVNPSRGRMDVSAHRICYPGEFECGDGISVLERDGAWWCCVVDGLGHGPDAAVAAETAVACFEASKEQSPARIMEDCHRALNHTRGTAMAIAKIEGNRLHYSAIGNIYSYILSPETQQALISYDGIVGYTARKFPEKTYIWPPGGRLVMHSDGLVSRCNLRTFEGYSARNVRLAVAYLLRDGRRGRDDIGVLVASERKR